MDEFLGTIKIFGFNFAPRGWTLCQGQLLSISANTALFSLLGTTYGGNGQTTFGLPDLRGRTAIGAGQGPGLPDYSIGEVAGSPAVTLTSNQMPIHTHAATATAVSTSTSTSASTLVAEGTAADAQNPNNKMLATGNFYTTPNPANNRTMAAESIATTTTTDTTTNVTVTVAQAGGSQPVSVMNPFLAVNYSICLSGIFPSRN